MGACSHCSSSWSSSLRAHLWVLHQHLALDSATRALGTTFDQPCLWDQILLSLPAIYCGCFKFRAVDNTNLWGQLEGRNGSDQGAQY